MAVMVRSVFLVCLLLLFAPFAVCYADGDTTIILAQESTAEVDADRAATIAREATGGRVLGVESETEDGKLIYRVKILSADGQLRVVTVDGVSGKVR